jgi:carboxypeptidase C (cathepsin A)
LSFQSTTEEAAIDAAALSFVFFEHFSELKGNPFHMAGSSFGGRYIPMFASAVHDLNKRLVKSGLDAVNLSSVMIGTSNACTGLSGL